MADCECTKIFGSRSGRCRSVLLVIALTCLVHAGCGSVEWRGAGADSGGKGLFADGVTAGLFVASEDDGPSNATLVFWGVTHAGRPEKTFGKMFSHHAAQAAGGRVLYLGEGPRLCGDVRPFLEAADVEEVDIVFVGRIENWRQNYILFFQWAVVRFSLSCHAVPDGDMLWEADVSRRGWYSTHREVFVRALDDLFRARR